MSKTTKLFAGFVVASVALSLVVVGTASAAGYTFTSTLKMGSRGAEVMELQKVLNSDSATQVAATGPGSAGNETTTFGGLTKAAVIKFQNKYASEVLTPVGLTSGTGLVGAMTRAKLNAMSGTATGGTTGLPAGCTSTTGFSPTTGQSCSGGTVIPSGTGLTVTDPGQPGVSLAPATAARVPFTKVKLTAGNDGDVTVNSITVERTGLAVDTNFSGIVLLDENGIQIGDAKTFNSNHQANVGVPFTVKAGTSKVVTIAGNMAAAATVQAGQVASLTVMSVNTNGAVVSGVLPITGAAHTINATLSLGSVTLGTSSYDPNTSASKEVGTTGYKFTGFRLTAGSTEKVRLWSVRWYQSGSVASGDFANVQTYVDGVAYPVTVSSDGKYYTSIFPGGILMDKGTSKDIWVAGDIVGTSAAGRTIQFDIFKTTDVYLTGETYGYGVTPPAGSVSVSSGARTTTTFTNGNPWIQSSTVTVTAGSATSITKSSSVQAQNIAAGVPNQILGGFETDMKGEPITVQQMVFTVATSSGTGTGLLTNVSLVDQNGAVVAGPVDATDATATDGNQTLTFTDTVTLPVGKRVYTLKGKVPSDTGNNMTYQVTTVPSTGWTNITGLVTGNSITLSQGSFTMNTMTVKAGALAITVSPTPATQTIVAGGTARTFANYQLDASQSGEDVRLNSFKAQLTFTGAADDGDLSGCQLFDGGNPLNSTVVDPASSGTSPNDYTFTFDSSLVVPKGTVKTLALKCNVSTSVASGTFAWGIDSTNDAIAPTGMTSGVEVSDSITSATGQTMTVGSGSIAVSKDSSSYRIVAAGTSGQEMGRINLLASNEDINLEKLGFSLTGASIGEFGTIEVFDGTTLVGSLTPTTNNATTTLTTPLLIKKDTNKVLTIKLSLPNIGKNEVATTSGKLLTVNYNSGEGKGIESGVTKYTTGTSSFDGLRVMKAYPVITYDTTPGTLTNGQNDLAVVKITASNGDVVMNKLTFSIATTTVNFTALALNGPTGNVSSTTNPVGLYASTTSTGSYVVYFDSTSNTDDKKITVAGGSKTYTLRGTVSMYGTNTTGSVSTALKADTAYPTLTYGWFMASTTVSGLTGQNILWSPVSTTTMSGITTAYDDWTNGYGLGGCFTTLGQDCPSRVLSK